MTEKLVIVLGDKTSHGGTVISGNDAFEICGKPVACMNDNVSCPLHGNTLILEGFQTILIHPNKVLAYDGCKTSCGATLIAGGQDVFFVDTSSKKQLVTPDETFASNDEIDADLRYLALTIYGEARGKPDSSKRAIAWVIRNRLKKNKKRWGKTYKSVVLARSQFSCWNHDDPNYRILQHPGEQNSAEKIAWEKCKKIAEEVHNAPENENPVPGVCNYFSGERDKEKKWEENYYDIPEFPGFHFVKLNE